jgi:hypothetical protein
VQRNDVSAASKTGHCTGVQAPLKILYHSTGRELSQRLTNAEPGSGDNRSETYTRQMNMTRGKYAVLTSLPFPSTWLRPLLSMAG